MKKITLAATLLSMLAPVAQMWASTGSTTYYAALKAQVSSESTGMGKVYAGTSDSAGTYATPSSQSSNLSSTTQNDEKTFYAFAQANDGYEFLGWSTTENDTTYASTANPYPVKGKCESKTESDPTLTTVYANFKKLVLASFNITFETSDAGSYTVDGAAPANKTGLTEATSVTLASSDPNFLNWLVNGSAVSANPYVANCTAETTISAEFLTADQVTSVSTLAELTSALANSAYRKITIPSGTAITVAKGSSVSVPSGKILVADGTLVVLGTLSNSGTISGNGTLYKISYTIDQGDVITPVMADGTECGIVNSTYFKYVPKYCKTTVSANSPGVSGTIGCSETWGVMLNGSSVYAIGKQNPAALKVTVDSSSAVNKITGVSGNVDAITTTDKYLLLANCSLSGPKASNGRYNFQGVVDCAGKTLTVSGAAYDSNFYSTYLNGTVKFNGSSSYYFQNGKAVFLNCASVTVQYCKNTGNLFYFYDCGTSSSPCAVSFSYYSSTRTSDYRTAYFYSGFYTYTFNSTNDSGKCNVYGGSFTTDPSAYIPSSYDGVLSAKYDGSKYYVVQGYIAPSSVCSVDGTDYGTLEEAIEAASNGSTILLSAAVELSDTLTIPAGKNLTLSLEKHTISGGKIVNNGTLLLTDSITGNGTTASDASGGAISCDIENNGTLDFAFGTYSGSIVNNAGTLITHNGIFSGAFSREGGTVNLEGGHFATDVTAFVTAGGYDVISSGNMFNVCELPDGTLYDTTVSSASGYGATPYSTDDYNLMVKWVGGNASRTDYTAAEWMRLGELLGFYQLFNNCGLDPSLVFDRYVEANSVNLYAKSGNQSMSVPFKAAVSAGTPYRALSEYLNGNGYASKTYKAIFSEGISSVGIAATDKSGNNNGTLCKAMVELWESARAADYSSTGHKVTNTVYEIGAKYFTIGAGSNIAMIRPATGAATFYSTLGAAMDAAADGGTVMLANDCVTAFPLTKAGAYTFDTMGFAHSDDLSVADGLFVKSATSVDSSAKVLIADAVATTYVVAQKVAQVGETFYDNLTEAIANANGVVVTLLAATDETVTLGEGQSLKLAVASGVSYDTASKIVADPSLAGYGVKATAGDGYTLYELAPNSVESDGVDYASVTEAISAGGDEVEVIVKSDVTETVSLDAGKTLAVTVEDGVSANVTVEPAQGAFIEAEASGATTTYVSKEITVEMAEPQNVAAVEMASVENGETNTVSDASLVNAAIACLTGNGDVERTDNTDKLGILDTITVTPAKIVQEVVGEATVIRSATFDVVPAYEAGQSLGEGQTLKFRLPVDAAATQLASIVYHDGAQFGVYPVQTYNGEKFIEVESGEFSPYGYTLLDGETANPVAAIGTTGYATLAEALAAASGGDTVVLLADIEGVTETFELRGKNITIDGGGHSVTAGENTEPRGVIDSWGGARNMFVAQSGNVTFRNITLDGGETHYYTFLVQAKGGTTTFEDVALLHGGESDTSGTAGVGYGAAVQVDGASVVVNGSFYADTHGAAPEAGETDSQANGIFPFTALLYQSGDIHFDDGVTAGIGQDLLLVGMVGAVDVSTPEGKAQVQGMLDGMNVPAGFAPYTLTLGDNDLTSFTGASPLGWNDIIDYGKEIMDVSAELGMEMDKNTTPVEVGLLADTVLSDTFVFGDSNLTVNGNGNALSGTIKYTDDAGKIENIEMGVEGGEALVLDMTEVTKPIELGSGVAASNVVIRMTEAQATAGTPVVTWDAGSGVAAPENEAGVSIRLVDEQGDLTGDEAELVWDDELGMAYIGPCEARLTDADGGDPWYSSLAAAVASATNGCTVTLLTDIVDYAGTMDISQSITLDGAGHSISAAPMTEHRNMFDAWAGGTAMVKVKTGTLSLRNITLDGDATHRYTFLVSADNDGASIVTENVTLLHGGEQSLDADGATLTPGNGYGAAIHLNNGANLVVSNGFHACTGTNENGVTTGVFPFTAILPENLEAGTSVKFELSGDPNDPANVDIGDDMLLVGMVGDLIDAYGMDAVQGMLDHMQVPSRFIPYTLTLGDGSAYAFTGASPLGWNDIIDYGKDIMDVSAAMGFDGMDTATTPVEVGLVSDTVLPDTFVFEDANLTVNGNGNALSGEIKYTDNAGLIEDIVMGTADNPLVLDVTEVSNPIEFGAGISVTNVTIRMAEEQATAGTPVVIWDAEGGVDAPANESGILIALVDSQGESTGDSADLVWDNELGLAYIGPCDARLTGPTHDLPTYASLSNTVEQAAASGDAVTLMANVTLAARQAIGKSIVLDLNGNSLVADGDALLIDSGAAVLMDGDGTVTGNVAVASGSLTITNGVYVGTFGKTGGDDAEIIISGGFFSEKVLAEYCAEGYFPTERNPETGLYTVTQGYAEGDTPEIASDTAYAITSAEAAFLNSLLAVGYDKETEVAPAIAALESVEAFGNAALLNIDLTQAYEAPAFAITSVRRSGANVLVTVALDRKGYELANKINGVLTLATSSDGKVWGEGVEVEIDDDDFSGNGTTATVTLPAASNANFFKATISGEE